MKTLHFYRDASGKFRWRVIATNGRIQATGAEGYNRRNDCMDAASAVLRIEIADGKALGYGYSIHAKREIGFHEVMKLKCDL